MCVLAFACGYTCMKVLFTVDYATHCFLLICTTFFYVQASQSYSTQPGGKHERNPRVIILIVKADKATIHYGDPYHGGLLRCFYRTRGPPVFGSVQFWFDGCWRLRIVRFVFIVRV